MTKTYKVHLYSYGVFVKTLAEYEERYIAEHWVVCKWIPMYGSWSIELIDPDGNRCKRFWE